MRTYALFEYPDRVGYNTLMGLHDTPEGAQATAESRSSVAEWEKDDNGNLRGWRTDDDAGQPYVRWRIEPLDVQTTADISVPKRTNTERMD